MSKSPHPSAHSTSSRAAPNAAAGPAEKRAAPEPPPAPGAPRDFKTMMCRVNRAGWQEMSRLAIDQDRNLEDLLIQACNDLLAREGFRPVIEKRSPVRR